VWGGITLFSGGKLRCDHTPYDSGASLVVSVRYLGRAPVPISGVYRTKAGVIPGAGVTVVNRIRDHSSFETDATGTYHVPSLIPGPYGFEHRKAALKPRFDEFYIDAVGLVDKTRPLKGDRRIAVSKPLFSARIS